MKTFGEVISELRKERGLTQKALAAQVKKKDGTAIGLAYINDIEHDRRGPPAPDFVAQLAAVLGVPLDVLQFYAGRLPRTRRRNGVILHTNRSWRPIARFVGSYRKSEETDHERAHLAQAPAAPGLFHPRAARRTV